VETRNGQRPVAGKPKLWNPFPVRKLAMTCVVFLLLVACCPFSAMAATPDELIRQLQELQAADDASAPAVQHLRQIEADIPTDAPYALRRAQLRAELVVFEESLGFEGLLARIQTLRDLAEANGDEDTVALMDIKRILKSHSDDNIGKFIDQLNEVRARIRSNASPEVMEALELSYGNMYFDAGNFDTALRHQLAALDWAEKLPFGRARARLFRLATIAELYNAMDLPDSALETIARAFAHPVESIPLQNRISLLGARARALMQKGRLIEADKVLGEAEDLAKDDKSTFTARRIGTMRAELLLAMSKSDEAIEVINRIEALARQRNDSYYLAKTWMLRGHALMQLGRVDEGLALMQQATDYFEAKGQMVDVLDGLDRQIATLREKKLYGRAVDLMERRQTLWSQLFHNERGRAIAEVEARQTAQELETRIATLSAENRIQQTRLHAERLGKALALVLALFAITLSSILVIAIRRARRERDTLSDAVRLDALTGASSRYQFQRRRAPKPVPGASTALSTGVLLLDLDHFKAINDQHGHEAGDAVLQAVVERIRRVLGSNDELYRWGGEEFLVILNNRDSAALEQDVLRILAEIENPAVPWHGQSLPVSVSGGHVRLPLARSWQTPLVDAIRWADASLYIAKNSGRRRVEQVELTEAGRVELIGHRPLDMPQLLDWQRRGYVRMHTLTTEDHAT
jgi:diguanylate cyclase (GGDEF)-like protein